jgi:hypothetical protein
MEDNKTSFFTIFCKTLESFINGSKYMMEWCWKTNKLACLLAQSLIVILQLGLAVLIIYLVNQ